MNDLTNGWVWFGFAVFVVIALSFDTFLMNKSYERPYQSIRASLRWTGVWVASALIFNVLLWLYFYATTSVLAANGKALDFLTGYLIEKSLSVDNLFIFYIIFKHLHIPVAEQQRVFTYGIWSAIVLRLLLILAGVWLVVHFHWILYLMGAFLLLTGIKSLLIEEKEKDLSENLLIRFVTRCFRLTPDLHGENFFVRINQRLYATPLLLALILIEFGDLVFAFDSIPAIFAITTDPFIVWSSNIFAILGLRALYFVLSGMMTRFYLLKYGVALILMFVGAKMLAAPWVHISALVSLSVIVSILVSFGVMSFVKRR